MMARPRSLLIARDRGTNVIRNVLTLDTDPPRRCFAVIVRLWMALVRRQPRCCLKLIAPRGLGQSYSSVAGHK